MNLIGIARLILGLCPAAWFGTVRLPWIVQSRGASCRFGRPGGRAKAWRLLLTACFLSLPVAAQVPGIITYQGRLTAKGTPFTGTAQFKFALVSPGGSTTLWSYNNTGNAGAEPSNPPISLAVTDGLFSVNLGDLTVSNMTESIPPSLFTNSAVYLRIWVNDGPDGSELMTPDQRIAAVGYAMTAASVSGPVASAASFTKPLAGDVTGTQGATVIGAVGGQPAANVAAAAAMAIAATNSNTPNTLVKRDSQGNFAAGSVAGAFIGDGSHLTNLTAASLTGALPSTTFLTSAPSGLAMISMLPQDPSLLAGGYQLVMAITPPGWVSGSTVNAPSARSGQAAVWDGQELIVWGGNTSASGFLPVSSGGMYRPDLDQWQAVTSVSAPAPRTAHTAVWTGSGMLVWGGEGTNAYLNTGAQFQPSNQPWLPINTTNAPAARSGHVACWTGSRMLIWGGQNNNGLLADGASYDPVAGQWTALNLTNTPVARSGAAAVCATNRLLVWGGVNELGGLNTGARLLLDPNGLPVSWTATTTNGAPLGRSLHSVVWTGQKMLVWGGYAAGAPLGDGAAYDPVADAWSPLNLTNAPTARASHTAVWTGQEMLVFGGETSSGTAADGAAYNPATDSWRPLSAAGAPLARSGASAAWSGSELLVFAGLSNGQPLAALQRLNPQPPWYLYRKP